MVRAAIDILIFLAGAVLGCLVFILVEPRLNALVSRHGKFVFSSWAVMRFLGIAIIAIGYFYPFHYLISGAGAGMVIFSLLPK